MDHKKRSTTSTPRGPKPKLGVPHVHSVKKVLASGEVATFYYHRHTRKPLPGPYGSPQFWEALQAASASIARKDRGAPTTLEGLLDEFQNTSRWRDKLADSTKKEYLRVFNFWRGTFGSLPISLLAAKAFRADVLRWHDEFSADHPREADNRVTILARVLAWAAADRNLTANVLAGFERAYSSDRSEKIWLPEHIKAFMAVASPEMQLAMMLALHTGQRQADIRAMAWSNYDGRFITIRQGKSAREGQAARQVIIPCTKALKATLDAAPRHGALMLTTKTGLGFQKRYFAECWDEVVAKTEVTGLHFHDIRGTTITMLFEAGCSVAEAASITGHTLRYAQTILDKYLARTSVLAEAAILKFEARLDAGADDDVDVDAKIEAEAGAEIGG